MLCSLTIPFLTHYFHLPFPSHLVSRDKEKKKKKCFLGCSGCRSIFVYHKVSLCTMIDNLAMRECGECCAYCDNHII